MENKDCDRGDSPSQYRDILVGFWNADATFSADKKRLEDDKTAFIEEAEEQLAETTERLSVEKNRELSRIRAEEQRLLKLIQEVQNRISGIVQEFRARLDGVNLGHLLNLAGKPSPDRPKQLTGPDHINQLLSETERTANDMIREIGEYEQWLAMQTNIRAMFDRMVGVATVVLALLLLLLIC